MQELMASRTSSPGKTDHASRLYQYLTSARSGVTPKDLFGQSDDAFWFWANTQGYREHAVLRKILPGLPDATIQENYTGKHGEATLLEAFKVYVLFRRIVEANLGSIAHGDKILDFGCGWGRIIRFFLRDLAPEKIWGIDCMPEAIQLCTAHNPWCQFKLIPIMPPTELEADRFDFIYAFSVFSHLSEEAHLAWLKEFHRILKPNGLVLLTTRDRQFIEYCESLRRSATLPRLGCGPASSFQDVQYWLSAYDRGMFCHTPTGGGGNLSKSFYGETCIPRAYAATRWSEHFQLLDFIEDRSICEQNVIVARKK